MSEEIIEGEQGLKPVELGFHVLAIDFFFSWLQEALQDALYRFQTAKAACSWGSTQD